MSQHIKILAVDDEPLITELVQMALAPEGYHVDTANNATQALVLVEGEAYQLVITDYTLPDLRGDRLAQALRQKATPVPFC